MEDVRMEERDDMDHRKVNMRIDVKYEFSAPRYHDFLAMAESELEDKQQAEQWFQKLNDGTLDTDLTSPTTSDVHVAHKMKFVHKIADKMNIDQIQCDDEDIFESSEDNVEGGQRHEDDNRENVKPVEKQNYVEERSTTGRQSRCRRLLRNPEPVKTVYKATVPKSPALRTSTRHRSTAPILSTEERQMLEARKHMQAKERQSQHGDMPSSLGKRSNMGNQKNAVKKAKSEGHTMTRRSQTSENAVAAYRLDSCNNKVTIPMSPMLRTRSRSRTNNLKTVAEKEKEELSQIMPFKARPLNRKIFESSGDSGLPKVDRKLGTQVKAFHLSTETRAAKHKSEKSTNNGTESSGLKPQKNRGKTRRISRRPIIPESPAFHTRARVRQRGKSIGPSSIVTRSFRAKAAPKFDRTPLCKKIRKRRHTTAFEPFKLHTTRRGTMKQDEIERARHFMEAEEQSKRNFKAREIPDPFDLYSIGLNNTCAKIKSPTVPKPFKLLSSNRHSIASAKLADTIKTKLQEETERRTFKARPSLSTCRKPFQPIKANKQNTAFEEVELNSKARANKRQAWNDEQAKRRVEEDLERKRLDEIKKEKDAEDIRKLRKTLEFKARPLPKYLR